MNTVRNYQKELDKIIDGICAADGSLSLIHI